ncbi:hypothetical protein Rhe02_47270 [Rhizocola hellebori]|uniref:Apea-like HEPN domain-containing protein n=1 Tax=Rhizocola hellebori TaxID=1392758 RepID=A0A8J3Q9Y6_9ACTN|nr:HEPN domain-containing protein [Rhizocola hellebori]GIH06660.1 hypothetical protein Rhe02_47270 [Rhizocola hellebori]
MTTDVVGDEDREPTGNEGEPASRMDTLKSCLHKLAQEVLVRARDDSSQLKLGVHRTALYSDAGDREVTGLGSFAPSTEALLLVTGFTDIADPSEVGRVVLQFTYDCLERHHAPEFDTTAFDQTWASFVEELTTPYWRFLSVCQLENFVSDAQFLDLGDGISIHDRTTYGFEEHGWSDFQVKTLYSDWNYASNFILLAEELVPKAPTNLILGGTTEPIMKSHRMIRALRLAKEGDVHIGGDSVIGRMLTNRPAGSGFTPNGGSSTHGTSPRWPGPPFSISTSDIARVTTLYDQLTVIGAMQGRTPYNLDLALRSFHSSYDRIPAMADTRMVDLVTAAEALLGTENEIIFRLSFRMAGLLASSDAERTAIFGDMKAFYDTRSKVVHGAPLKPKHQACLKNYSVLRDHVRRIIVGFLCLATSSSHSYSGKFFTEQLDAALQDGRQRDDLRTAMGLN